MSLLFLTSCKKEKQKDILNGTVWVETTKRLDTLDFAAQNSTYSSSTNPQLFLRGKSYTNTSGSLVIVSAVYQYYISGEKLFLKNFISSSSAFGEYTFSKMDNLLMISKFYNREELPATLHVEKVK